ncbi:MAG: M48 family metalloprotease, partial [Hamadaea sp.]|nr:M48 family metalloprotease [Hamadaea sp.]
MRPQPRPRLNPFVLPSATATQFVLLVTAVVGGSMFIYNYLLVLVPSRYGRAVEDCLADATAGIGAGVDGHTIVTSYEACWRAISRTNGLLVLAGFAGLLLVAALLYLAHPVTYRVLHRLSPPEPNAGAQLSERVRALAAQAGLARPPRILIRPVWTVDAYSFGLRRKTVVLNRGLLRKPAVLDAYLRHELGHLRNGDIGLTQFVLAAWRAFVLAAIVPFVVGQAADPSSFTVRVLVNMGIVLAAIYLGTLSVLRLREHYADVRATTSDGADGAFGSLVARAQGGSGWLERLRWRRRRHPTAADRRTVVTEPDRLLRLGVLPMVVAGLSLGIGARSFPQLLTDLLIGISADLNSLVTAGFRLAIGALVAGAVGTACWRAAVTSVVHRTRLPGALLPGGALAAGILVGTSINDLQTGSWWAQVTTSPAAGLISAAFLLVICVFFLQWSIASGALWLEVTPTAAWRR